ncbi:MAG: tripartite tricarboxylate transporter substrate binding protein [Telluria sp.]
MKKNASAVFAGLLSVVLALAGAGNALAQSAAPYPHSRVTLVTHSSPGGGSDVFLRDLAKTLGPIMGVNFIVENVTGGSGAKAMAHVAKAKADGSVFYATTPTYIQTSLLSRPEVNYLALEPVAILFQDPEVIFTRADAPWKSLTEVLERARREPGKSRWGAANPASLERIALERLARKAGVKVPVVPHEGGGDMMINVLNGTLDIGVGEMQELQGQLQAGKIRILATLSDTRLALLPQVPTVKEQGVDLTVRKFRGLAGPQGIPASVTAALEAGIQKALENAAYKASYTKNDLLPAFMGRQEAGKFTTEFVGELTQSMKDLGVIK